MVRCVVFVALTACGRFDFDPRSDARQSDARVDGDVRDVFAGDALSFDQNIAFVTSVMTRPGDLGGLAGADAFCQARASAGGLAGDYVAWLSTGSVAARDRLAGSRGWVRVDGMPVVDTVADLVAGKMLYPMRVDELGVDHLEIPTDLGTTRAVITGTGLSGNTSMLNCTDYSVADSSLTFCGELTAEGRPWTDSGETFCKCDSMTRLYCFGTGKQAPVSLVPSEPYAFVSTGWNPGGGVTSADARCQADAGLLPGTYRALLATTAASAASRFSLSGPVWKRVDGAPLAATRADVMMGLLTVAPDLQASGAYLDNYASTGVGYARTANDLGDPAGDCNDWTDSTNAMFGDNAPVASSGPQFFSHGGGAGCSSQTYVYCLEL